MSVTNAGTGSNWNLNAGPQSNVTPTGMITSDAQMQYAVQSRFYNRAVRLAPTRHGAIYDVRVNNDVRSSLQHIFTMVQSDPNRAAFVAGPRPFPTAANVLITVAHMPARKSMTWNTWLRYRVREAKMHLALYKRVAATHRTSSCSPVPMLYFAGVDHASGLYYVVMERRAGIVGPLSTIESQNKLSMGMYRAIEAAIGSLWYVGAMLADTSAGNMLMTSTNHVVMADFDSAIVIPAGLKDRLHAQLETFYTMRRTQQGPCRTIRGTEERELVNMWDFVMRESSNRPSLQRLAIDVYGRRRWFPDVELLRTLKISTRANTTPSKLRGMLGGVGGSGGRLRNGLRGLLRGRSENNRDGGSDFLNVRLRKIGALSNEEKSVWRRRQRRPKERRAQRERRTSTRNTYNRNTPASANLPSPPRPGNNVVNVNNVNNNNNNRVPMPSRSNSNARRNNNINTKLPNGLASLVDPLNTIFQQGFNLNKKNNATAAPKNTSPPKQGEFGKYTAIQDSARQAFLLDHEVDRFIKQTQRFKNFKAKLIGGDTYPGSSALDAGIREMHPEMGWVKMSNVSKRKQRKLDADRVAEALVRKALDAVLEMNIPGKIDRDRQTERILEAYLTLGWGEWFMSFVKNPRR